MFRCHRYRWYFIFLPDRSTEDVNIFGGPSLELKFRLNALNLVPWCFLFTQITSSFKDLTMCNVSTSLPLHESLENIKNTKMNLPACWHPLEAWKFDVLLLPLLSNVLRLWATFFRKLIQSPTGLRQKVRTYRLLICFFRNLDTHWTKLHRNWKLDEFGVKVTMLHAHPHTWVEW